MDQRKERHRLLMDAAAGDPGELDEDAVLRAQAECPHKHERRYRRTGLYPVVVCQDCGSTRVDRP